MGLGVRRLAKGHASADVWPWAARGADSEAGRRAGACNVVARRRSGPKRVADPLFKIEKLQIFV
jgi:hypothetical protein